MSCCVICNQSPDRSHVILLTDKVGRHEIKGCQGCIDELYKRIRSIEDRRKMTNEKLFSVLELDGSGFEYMEF